MKELREQLLKKRAEYDKSKKDCKTLEKEKENLEQLLEDLEEVRIIFQNAAQITQQQLATQIEDIVSKAMSAVFQDEPYEFVVDFVKRRNVTECDLLFKKNGEVMDPLTSCGYGAADVASLALRVAFWKISGTTRNFFALDEPGRNLDANKQPLMSYMIKKLSEFGIQFLIVTHQEALTEHADRVFRTNGTGKIIQVR